MKAQRLVSFAPMTMELEEVHLPDRPGHGQLLVEAETTAISAGTEVANYRGITTQRRGVTDWRANPYRPGYSLAGIVRAVGEGVEGVAPGDRVCGHGPHASAALVEAARVVPVPPEVSADQAAMTTLCVIAMNAVRLAHLQLGESVAVVGAGLIGQLAAQFARLSGARPVVSVDPIEPRRRLALDCGADAAFAPEQVDQSFDIVFEATGSPAAFNPALKMVRRQGRMIALGSTRGIVESFDLYGDLHLRGVTLIGAHASTAPQQETPYNPWTESRNRSLALRLIRDEELRLDRLVSHRVPASEGPAMFHRLATSREDFYGVLLRWRG
jgi:2-desacetyl-2-hydroxyethyl bacteriochlorophyllide A dehydrogenase